jgi:LPS sulfotransferase NodH
MLGFLYSPQRFVVLFEGRTGSTYLIESLNSSSYIRAEGEILVDSKDLDWRTQEKKILQSFRGSLLRQPRAVGFKTKLRDITDPEAFSDLLQSLDVKLIFLKRRNRIKTVVSMFRSRLLKEKVGDYNARSKALSLGKLPLDPDKFDELLKMREALDDKLEEFVDTLGLPTLEMFYEELLADETSFFQRIYEFLGVPYAEGRGETVKNTSDDLRESVENYEELKSRYAGTPYEAQFGTD